MGTLTGSSTDMNKIPTSETMQRYANMADFELRAAIRDELDLSKKAEMNDVLWARQHWS